MIMRKKERERTTFSPVFAKGIRVIARTYKLLGEFKNGKARERVSRRSTEQQPRGAEVGSEVKLGSVTREGWGGRFHHNNFPGH